MSCKKHVVGVEGCTVFERLNGKMCSDGMVELWAKIHCKFPKRHPTTRGQVGRHVVGNTGAREGSVGSNGGLRLVATNRRVGAQHRWDDEGLAGLRGVPWSWIHMFVIFEHAS